MLPVLGLASAASLHSHRSELASFPNLAERSKILDRYREREGGGKRKQVVPVENSWIVLEIIHSSGWTQDLAVFLLPRADSSRRRRRRRGYIPFPVVIVVGLHPVGREDERGGRRQRSVARVGGRTPVEWYIDRRQRCTVEWFRGECSGETHGVARSGD